MAFTASAIFQQAMLNPMLGRLWTTAALTGNPVTVAAAFGCLVYDNTITAGTVAKQGLCYNYFGGTQSVTAGSFTVTWPTVGAVTNTVFNVTV